MKCQRMSKTSSGRWQVIHKFGGVLYPAGGAAGSKAKYSKAWEVVLAISVEPVLLDPAFPLARSWPKAWTCGSQAGTERKHKCVHAYNENTNTIADFKTGNSAILKNSWHLPPFSKVPKDLQP